MTAISSLLATSLLFIIGGETAQRCAAFAPITGSSARLSARTTPSSTSNDRIILQNSNNADIDIDTTTATATNSRRSFLSTTTSSAAAIAASMLLNINNAYATTNDEQSSSPPPMASFALRRAGSLPPSISNLPPSKLGIFVQFGESMLYSDDASRTPGKDVYASFQFPADWLQLDRILGGVQYVDQRNGDKLYVLKVKLPEGVDKLENAPKSYFGDAIFNPKGDLVRTGNNVEDYKVLSGSMLQATGEVNENGETVVPRRRLKIRYTTLTGNNFSVERKGLVDCYEVGGMVYMLMTGSNAVLFDKKGRERDTVEYIADTFRVVPV